MTHSLFDRYAPLVMGLSERQISNPQYSQELLMHRMTIDSRQVDMVYSPFDYVNENAKIVIVGMTPGSKQASNALSSAKAALQSGLSIAEASKTAKLQASFSGEPMRTNLVRMLDTIGVQAKLGLRSTVSLWNEDADLVHFTSALRYPVFVNGQNWSGQPDMIRTSQMRSWLEQYTGTELSLLKNAIIVPLGQRVGAAMKHLAANGQIRSDLILEGLPHPSGQNGERVQCFLGDKPANQVSPKTNAAALYTVRDVLTHRVSAI